MYTGWVRGFESEASCAEFAKQSGMTRQQMYAYLVIKGQGVWHEIAKVLPAAPPDPALPPPPDLQDPF